MPNPILIRRALYSGRSIQYLLGPFRFPTDQAAPLPSPYSEAGAVGALTVVDTGNKLTISGGALNSLSGTADDDPLIYSELFFRVAGRALLCRLGQTVDGASSSTPRFGWTSGTTSGSVYGGVPTSSVVNAAVAGTNVLLADVAVRGTAYDWAVILRTTGFFLIFNGKLAWVDASHNAANVRVLFGARGTNSAGFTLDNFRVVDLATLDSRFASDTALATSRLVSPAAGATFTHEGNLLLDFTTSALGGGTSFIRFRKQDASNYWQIAFNSANFSLREVVSGTPTTRASDATANAAATRFVVVIDGSVIKGYSNNTLRWTYSSASNFSAATAGEIESVFASTTIAEVCSWPRQVTLPSGI